MRIADDKIDEVRSASDIVDVISAYVSLKKRGKNYLGLCPFHQEKTPSFTVSAEKQMYHCFGCGVGGNVFTFVMEHEKVSFIEAVRTLAERAGISLPSPEEGSPQATENEGLYAACRTAGLYFYENLVDTVEGKLALEYFHHRGFTDETIRKFGLGYSMNAWDGLVRYAEREKLDVTILEKAGLVMKREDGSSYYDRFRGRAMFPIFSPSGRTIGFGARKMREDDPLGKYINSPETPIYIKSRSLYGLFQSKEAIRSKENAILVEGYADLISVFQAGIENIVASSGTALTEEQIQLVGRYARSITLVYDADSAGSKATIRGVDLIIEGGLDVKVSTLPEGEDPDSFVKKFGGKAFQKLVDDAVSFLDFKVALFRSQGLLDTPEGKTQAVRSIVETIAKMKDELKRNFYIKSVSEKYDIYETVLFRELERLLGQQQSSREHRSDPAGSAREVVPVDIPQVRVGPVPVSERDLLKVMIENGNEMVDYVFARIGPEMLEHPDAQRVVQEILRHLERGVAWDGGTIVDAIDDEHLKHFVADLMFTRYELSKGWASVGAQPQEANPRDIAEDSIRRLRLRDIDQRIAREYRLMKEAEMRGGPLLEFQKRILVLQQERRETLAARPAKSTDAE